MLKIEFWWCLAKPSSMKHPTTVDGDKFRDAQLNNEKSEKPWNTEFSKGFLHQTLPLKGQESTWKRRWKDNKSQKGYMIPRK